MGAGSSSLYRAGCACPRPYHSPNPPLPILDFDPVLPPGYFFSAKSVPSTTKTPALPASTPKGGPIQRPITTPRRRRAAEPILGPDSHSGRVTGFHLDVDHDVERDSDGAMEDEGEEEGRGEEAEIVCAGRRVLSYYEILCLAQGVKPREWKPRGRMQWGV